MKIRNKVLAQVIKEFWIPLTIAVLWASWDAYTSTSVDKLQSLIKALSASFFLSSWALGQLNRIRKQQRVESDFESVKSELKTVINNFQLISDRMAGHFLGIGGKLTFHARHSIDEDHVILTIMNESEYPVFDISVISTEVKGNKRTDEMDTRWETVYPGRSKFLVYPLNKADRWSLTLFFRTRSKGFKLMLVGVRQNGYVHIAQVYTPNMESPVYNIPEGFPGYIKRSEEKIFDDENARIASLT